MHSSKLLIIFLLIPLPLPCLNLLSLPPSPYLPLPTSLFPPSLYLPASISSSLPSSPPPCLHLHLPPPPTSPPPFQLQTCFPQLSSIADATPAPCEEHGCDFCVEDVVTGEKSATRCAELECQKTECVPANVTPLEEAKNKKCCSGDVPAGKLQKVRDHEKCDKEVCVLGEES